MEKKVNICIDYEIDDHWNISSHPTPKNCPFGAVKLTKHVDVNLYKYSGYGTGFDTKGFYSIGDEICRNVMIFGVDISLSSHIDNKKKRHLGCAQALKHTLTTEKLYSVNFTKKIQILFKLAL